MEPIGGEAQGVHGTGVCSCKLGCSARVRPAFGRVASKVRYGNNQRQSSLGASGLGISHSDMFSGQSTRSNELGIKSDDQDLHGEPVVCAGTKTEMKRSQGLRFRTRKTRVANIHDHQHPFPPRDISRRPTNSSRKVSVLRACLS